MVLSSLMDGILGEWGWCQLRWRRHVCQRVWASPKDEGLSTMSHRPMVGGCRRRAARVATSISDWQKWRREHVHWWQEESDCKTSPRGSQWISASCRQQAGEGKDESITFKICHYLLMPYLILGESSAGALDLTTHYHLIATWVILTQGAMATQPIFPRYTYNIHL